MKKQKVNTKDFIRIMREEYNRTLEKISKLDDSQKKDKDNEDSSVVEIDVSDLGGLLSPGLNIHHNETGINYQIVKVGKKESVIESPDKKKYLVSNDAIDKNFSIN